MLATVTIQLPVLENLGGRLLLEVRARVARFYEKTAKRHKRGGKDAVTVTSGLDRLELRYQLLKQQPKFASLRITPPQLPVYNSSNNKSA